MDSVCEGDATSSKRSLPLSSIGGIIQFLCSLSYSLLIRGQLGILIFIFPKIDPYGISSQLSCEKFQEKNDQVFGMESFAF